MNRLAKYSVIGATILGLVGAVGIASADESGERKGGKRGFNFEKMDANGDGFVTADEIIAAHNARFTNQDANGDGFLTKEEVTAAMELRAAEHNKELGEKSAKRLDKFFERADADNDGKIAKSEMRTPNTAKLIEKLDTDGDGKISMAEAEAMKGKHKHKQKEEG